MAWIERARLQDWTAEGRAWDWQRALLHDHDGGLDARLQRIVAVGSPAVRARLEAWLADPDPEISSRGLTAAQALWVLRSGGAKVVDVWQDWGFLLSRQGTQFALAPEAVWLPDREGTPGEIEALRRSLDRVAGRWRMVVGLVEPVPPGVDPQPVARAVQLWQNALQRGDRVGRTAVYEDDGLSVDLALTDSIRADDEGCLLFMARPLHVEQYLATVAERIEHRLSEQQANAPFMPVVPALSGSRPWRLTRRWFVSTCYGHPHRTEALRDGSRTSWKAWVERSEGWFGGEGGSLLGGLLWLDPLPGEPLGCKLWSLHNPWCEPPLAPRWAPGPGLAAELTGQRRDEVELTWQDGRVPSWSPP